MAIRTGSPRQEFERDFDGDGTLESLAIEGSTMPCAEDWGAKRISVIYETGDGKRRMVDWMGYNMRGFSAVDDGIVIHGRNPAGKNWAVKLSIPEGEVSRIYGPAFARATWQPAAPAGSGEVNAQRSANPE